MVRAERRHRWCGNVFDLLSHPASEHLYKNASPGLQCLRCGPAMAEQNRKYIKACNKTLSISSKRLVSAFLPPTVEFRWILDAINSMQKGRHCFREED